MKIYGKSVSFALTLMSALALLLVPASCIRDDIDRGRTGDDNEGGSEKVAFVVRVPSTGGALDPADAKTRSGQIASPGTASNGHTSNGLPAKGYRDYMADADTDSNGTAWGGYPDLEAQTAAFEKAEQAMAANWLKGVGANGAKAKADDNTPEVDPATRAIVEGTNQVDDNRIEHITMLLFNGTSGLFLGKHTVADPASVLGDNSRKKFEVTLLDGNYKALFVANAEEEINDLIAAAGSSIDSKTVSYFDAGLKLEYTGKWNAKTGDADYRPFPMSSKPVDFSVPSFTDYTSHPVELARAVAKINVTTPLTAAEFAIEQIVVCNYSDGGAWLVPAAGWKRGASLFDGSALRPFGSIVDYPSLGSQLIYQASADPLTSDIAGNQCVDEIFVFEREGFDATDPGRIAPLRVLVKADITLGGKQHVDRWYAIELRKKNGTEWDHVDIIRNFKYNINIASVNQEGFDNPDDAYDNPNIGIVTDLDALDEEGLDDITYNGEYQLAVDRSVVILGPQQGSHAEMRVYTDYKNGWTSQMGNSSFFSASPDHTLGANGTSSTKVTITALTSNEGTPGQIRKTTLVYMAGALRKEITVVQLPLSENVVPDVPADMIKYVGAFWRAAETGERLIRMTRPASGTTVDGEWSAYVLDGADWIVLDTRPTSDKNVGWLDGATEADVDNGGDPGFDDVHKVSGSATWASGTLDAETPEVYFRIGLKTEHIPSFDHPARYATVLVTFADGAYNYLMYLRQGEDPDYLMKNGDPLGPNSLGTVSSRTTAQRISPYNLTAATLNASTRATQSPTADTDAGSGNPAIFTEYPSQAGAFFQWMSSEKPRYAWSPVGPISEQWPLASNNDVFWSDVSADNETCPPGYRRPTVGATDTHVFEVDPSEMVQSLHYNVTGEGLSGNYINGYYADGFFDRRDITDAEGDQRGLNSVVAANDANSVAYIGHLYFSPFDDASIFLPAAGRRGTYSTNAPLTDPVTLVRAGGSLSYWNSGAFYHIAVVNPPQYKEAAHIFGGAMLSGSAISYMSTADRANGMPIRCVAERPAIEGRDIELAYYGETKPFEVTSLDPAGNPVEWKITGYKDLDRGDTGFTMVAPSWLTVGGGGTALSAKVPARPATIDAGNAADAQLRATTAVSGVKDLSYAYDPSLRNTANSYIVNAAGRYSLPLVYGNAIEESKTGAGIYNTESYTSVKSGVRVLSRFKNHLGADINSPFISGAADAVLVWQTMPGLVQNVSLSADKKNLLLEVPASNLVQGNAVVAVRDANKVILWSWHIWVTPLEKAAATARQYDYTLSRSRYGFDIAKYNLGWEDGERITLYEEGGERRVEIRVAQTSGSKSEATFVVSQNRSKVSLDDNTPYWQWGRKDPLPPGNGYKAPSGYTDPNHPLFYDDAAYQWRWLSTTTASLGDAIQNPSTFFSGTRGVEQLVWSSEEDYSNLWDVNEDRILRDNNYLDAESVKTVYDPNPVGFKTPPAETFTRFHVGVEQRADNDNIANFGSPTNSDGDPGYLLYSIADKKGPSLFFHATGRRSSVNGDLQTATTTGNYALAMHSMAGNNRYGHSGRMGFSIGSSPAYVSVFSSNNIAEAVAMRPVKDGPATPPEAKTPGVPAAPGVIGYIWNPGQSNHLQLTLAGSKEYKNTPAADGTGGLSSKAFGPISNYTVRTAYFKWGSLVALGGEYHPDYDFRFEDVVAVPSEYFTQAGAPHGIEALNGRLYYYEGTAAWGKIPARPTTSTGWPATANLANGDHSDALGDPCAYYFGGFNGNDWKLPTGNASGWYNTGGSPFGKANASLPLTSGTGNGAGWWSSSLPVGGVVAGDGSGAQKWSMFLPAAGNRSTSDGAMQNTSAGRYWSSSTGTGSSLSFTNANVNPVNGTVDASAYAVRCVVDEPEIPGVKAVKGVIGYIWNPGQPNHLQLTLDGDKSYHPGGPGQLTSAQDRYTVYAAYFKFGSTVALSSQNNGTFSVKDIVGAASNGFDLAGLKTSVENLSGANLWNAIDDVVDAGIPLALGDNISRELAGPTFATRGLGDPCAFFGDGWQMPTVFDNIDFMGVPAGNPWENWAVGDPYGSDTYGFFPANWSYLNHDGTHAGTVGDPYTGSFPLTARTGRTAYSEVLPATGFRTNGTGAAQNATNFGNYWSSTIPDNGTGGQGYYLMFTSTASRPASANNHAYPVRCVPPAVSKPTGGAIAPPGVLGVSAQTGQLTLRGSKEYAGTPVEDDSEFGPLHPETVYIAVWKYGSAIAMDANPTSAIDNFDVSDLIWVPKEFEPSLPGLMEQLKASKNASDGGYSLIPYANASTRPSSLLWNDPHTAAELAAGLGNPCELADGGAWAADYRIPTSDDVAGTWNGVKYTTSTLPLASAAGQSGRRDTWSMFLPYTGNRSNIGATGVTSVNSGYYWSDSPASYSQTRNLNFGSTSVNSNAPYAMTVSAAIRCVAPPTGPTGPSVLEFTATDTYFSHTGENFAGGYEFGVNTDDVTASWTWEFVDPADESWVSVSGGPETGFLQINGITENYTWGPEPRTAKIVLKWGGVEMSPSPLTVYQYPNINLAVSYPGSGVIIDANGNYDPYANGTIYVNHALGTYTEEITMQPASAYSWLHVVDYGTELEFSADPNPLTTTRPATVTVRSTFMGVPIGDNEEKERLGLSKTAAIPVAQQGRP